MFDPNNYRPFDLQRLYDWRLRIVKLNSVAWRKTNNLPLAMVTDNCLTVIEQIWQLLTTKSCEWTLEDVADMEKGAKSFKCTSGSTLIEADDLLELLADLKNKLKETI